MKFKKMTSIMVLSMILSTTIVGSVLAMEADAPKATFRNQVTESEKESLKRYEALPEPEAWEIDLKGKKTKVKPIHKGSTSTSLVPVDGYKYVYDRYDLASIANNKFYDLIGSVYFENRSTTQTWPLKYTQESSTSITWNVSANLELETAAGAEFLAKVKAKAGFAVSREKTWNYSSIVENTLTVPTRSWSEIKKYSQGELGNGTIVYKKYSPSGTSLLGTYSEASGGWAVTDSVSWTFNTGALTQ